MYPQRTQIARAVIAQRATTLPARTPDSRVSRNPALRGKVIAPLRDGSRKSSAIKLTKAQVGGDSRGSLWAASAYVRPCTPEATPKWDWTVSSVAGR